MEDIAHKMTDEMLEETEKQLEIIYQEMHKEATKKMNEAMAKIELLPTDATQQQRINAWNKYNRLETIEKQIATLLVNVNKEAIAINNGLWTNVYGTNYNFISYNIETGTNEIGTMPILNKASINAILKEEFSPFTKIALDDIKNQAQALSEISRNILSGIVLGESNQEMAKRIQKVVNSNYSRAIRIARTETTRIQANARYDSMKYAKDKLGIKQYKVWSSTKDGRTRDTHRLLNGQKVDIDEKFEIRGHKAMHPGDFGRAEEDCNCRCTHYTELIDYKPSDKLDITFEEWKKQHESRK